VRSSNFGMQGTPISVALLRWRGGGAPDAGRLGEREVVEYLSKIVDTRLV
jgi:hypothetical protein